MTIPLNTIQENKTFSKTNYTHQLSNEINRLKSSIKKFENTHNIIPLSDDKYSKKTILEAFNQQGYLASVNYKSSYLITCNPFHENLRRKYGNTPCIIITPEEFLHFLSRQNQENMSKGLLYLLASIAEHYQSTDIHIANNRDIIIKRTQVEQLRLRLQQNDIKQLIYYLKLKCHLDPNTSLTPQDGAMVAEFNDLKLDIRLAALPTQHHEMITLRVFNRNYSYKSLNQLGFSEKKLTAIKDMMNQANGLILITGSTGSGKSTTLYTMLRELTHRHVVTIEDPIEQVIPNIHQTNVNIKQGYTFDVGLKAILRHSPDVIAIGEIRDQKTAEIVINAAYSGHLVIASLHTNTIETTLLRLENLGCSSFLISYCLRGIITQSLINNGNQTIELHSTVLSCKKPYIIKNIQNQLTEFLNHNKLINNES